ITKISKKFVENVNFSKTSAYPLFKFNFLCYNINNCFIYFNIGILKILKITGSAWIHSIL
ncbi:MAG: hypothetical protein K2H29_10755, partial [Oscillospiraceae bacterium]|nr:hypothetical protein [Oscillospiraceae bacterium]